MAAIDWKWTVAELGPRLFRYFSVALDRAAAEDLAQETLMRLVGKVESGAFDPSRASLSTFAFGIARYVQLEAAKHNEPIQLGQDDEGLHAVTDPSEGADVILGAEQARRALRAAISRLNDAERDVVLLMIDKELTMKEIGEILGMPENTVKSHARRAKENLSRALNPGKEL